MAFNEREYKNEYKKDKYKIFSVTLKKEEKEKLDDLLNKKGIKSSDFLRKAIEKLENDELLN